MGVVCAGTDVPSARDLALLTMVPGIRSSGANVYDQVRVDTPGDAMTRGADWLVIGRAVDDGDGSGEGGGRPYARSGGRARGPLGVGLPDPLLPVAPESGLRILAPLSSRRSP